MRYLPLTDTDRSAMLSEIGVSSVDDLFVDVPLAARFDGTFDLPDHMAEFAVEGRMARMAGRNTTTGDVPSFLGQVSTATTFRRLWTTLSSAASF